MTIKTFATFLLLAASIVCAQASQALQLKCVDAVDAKKVFYLKDYARVAPLDIASFQTIYFPWLSTAHDHMHQDRKVTSAYRDVELLTLKITGDQHTVMQIVLPWRDIEKGNSIPALYRQGYDDSPLGAGQSGVAACTAIP